MRYTKFFQYAYLVFGALFLYGAISKYVTNGKIDNPSILLAVVAVFMFFFRRKFAKKFDNKN